MLSIKRLVNAFWGITILLFLGILMYAYANMPDKVGINEGPGGLPDAFIERDTFFYLSLLIFLLTNGIFFGLRNMLAGKRRSIAAERLYIAERLQAWLIAFAASLNLLFVFFIIYLGVFNNPDYLRLDDYVILVYLGPIIVLTALAFLPFVFFRKPVKS